MQKEVTCCFTGHRAIEKRNIKTLQEQLEREIKLLIKDGFVRFGSGGALGFDLMAARTVLKLKKKYPQIKLFMALPCKNLDKYWNNAQKLAYREVLSEADEIVYTADLYYNGCMQKRNRYLVDQASCMIAYMTHDFGGTKYTVDYANKMGVKVKFLQAAEKIQKVCSY